MRVITIYSDRFILAINTHLYNRVIRLLNLIMSVDLEHHKRYMGVKNHFCSNNTSPTWTVSYITLCYIATSMGYKRLLSDKLFVCNIKIIGRVRVHSRSMFTTTLWNNCMIMQNIYEYTSLIKWALFNTLWRKSSILLTNGGACQIHGHNLIVPHKKNVFALT